MHFNHFVLSGTLLLLAAGFSGCKTGTAQTGLATGIGIEATDSCTANPANTYEVYIPQSGSGNPTHSAGSSTGKTQTFPLLVIIDSHGSGQFALDKFKRAADSYKVVLAASNLVKNNYIDYANAIQQLIDDVRQKYPVNETLYLTGFSGGARMVLNYAQWHPSNGIILCGALGSASALEAVKAPVFSISGMDDFNFVETAQYLFKTTTIPQNLKIELTHDSHSWPDSLLLENTVGFLSLGDPANAFSKKSRKAFCLIQEERIDLMSKQGDFMQAFCIAHNMATTPRLNKVTDFKKDESIILSEPGFTAQLGRLQQNLKQEMSLRQPYTEAFKTKDTLWWKKEVTLLDEKIQTANDPIAKDMFLRIKGFLGIACYSLGNKAIDEGDINTLRNVVYVYSLIEPENEYREYLATFIH